jgi:hypothetical protein
VSYALRDDLSSFSPEHVAAKEEGGKKEQRNIIGLCDHLSFFWIFLNQAAFRPFRDIRTMYIG